MRNTFIALACFLFSSCQQVAESNTIKKDSVLVESVDEPEGDANVGPSLAEVRAEWIARYNRTFVFDTSFNYLDSPYSFSFRHYCLFDSAIEVPALYDLETDKPFLTHHFNSSLLLRKGRDPCAAFSVGAEDFRSFADSTLSAFGVLSYPDILVKNDTIRIGYSLSIPVTDVGKHVTLYLRLDGKKMVTDE
ncbi:MAG: hypothetical protein ACK57D_00560 [Sphingobacteriales bacterium]